MDEDKDQTEVEDGMRRREDAYYDDELPVTELAAFEWDAEEAEGPTGVQAFRVMRALRRAGKKATEKRLQEMEELPVEETIEKVWQKIAARAERTYRKMLLKPVVSTTGFHGILRKVHNGGPKIDERVQAHMEQLLCTPHVGPIEWERRGMELARQGKISTVTEREAMEVSLLEEAPQSWDVLVQRVIQKRRAAFGDLFISVPTGEIYNVSHTGQS